jgi:hypothetical protein
LRRLQLVTQALEKARAHGIPAVTYERGQPLRDDFVNGNAIMVATYKALFNGRSKFGLRGAGQRHHEQCDLLLLACQMDRGWAEIDLGFTRRMRQRQENLLMHLLPGPNDVLERRVATVEAVFVTQSLEDPLVDARRRAPMGVRAVSFARLATVRLPLRDGRPFREWKGLSFAASPLLPQRRAELGHLFAKGLQLLPQLGASSTIISSLLRVHDRGHYHTRPNRASPVR